MKVNFNLNNNQNQSFKGVYLRTNLVKDWELITRDWFYKIPSDQFKKEIGSAKRIIDVCASSKESNIKLDEHDYFFTSVKKHLLPIKLTDDDAIKFESISDPNKKRNFLSDLLYQKVQFDNVSDLIINSIKNVK